MDIEKLIGMRVMNTNTLLQQTIGYLVGLGYLVFLLYLLLQRRMPV